MTSSTTAQLIDSIIDAWAASPSTHPHLGDWRRVGYHREALPRRRSQPMVVATTRGIQPNEPGDAGASIQNALNELGAAGGGTLVLAAGRYVLDGPLFMHDSNVVLLGAGKAETTLYFSRPLAESVFPTNAWSWTGGQIFFVPREARCIVGLSAMADHDHRSG